MEKCICFKNNSEDLKWYANLNKLNEGDIYLYKKYKIKFNTKKQRYKLIKPTQMGIYIYEIYDINENKILEFDENEFPKHFDTKSIIRNEILDKILND